MAFTGAFGFPSRRVMKYVCRCGPISSSPSGAKKPDLTTLYVTYVICGGVWRWCEREKKKEGRREGLSLEFEIKFLSWR